MARGHGGLLAIGEDRLAEVRARQQLMTDMQGGWFELRLRRRDFVRWGTVVGGILAAFFAMLGETDGNIPPELLAVCCLVIIPVAILVGITVTAPASLALRAHAMRLEIPEEEPWHWDVEEGWSEAPLGPERRGDDRGWALTPPPPETWNLDDPWAEDADGRPIDEHPTRLGTGRPAVFTWRTPLMLVTWIAALTLPGIFIPLGEDLWQMLLSALIGAMVIVMVIEYGRQMAVHTTLDTPKSLVRSVALGPVELVGQARPGAESTLQARFGPGLACDGLLAYRWLQQKQVKTGDDTYRWVDVSSDAAALDFVLHDGTGGITVDVDSFGHHDWGGPIHTWHGSHEKVADDQRWTLWGLFIGEPVYVLGTVKARGKGDAPIVGDSRTRELVVRGIGATGMSPQLRRGSELGVLSFAFSTWEEWILPGFIAAASLLLFVL